MTDRDSESSSSTRLRLTITGVVQGVGFRPFVYALASRFALSGHVGNESGGVFIEIEGPADALKQFQDRLLDEAPPLAHIEQVHLEEMEPREENGFSIVRSERRNAAHTMLSPDVCVCDDCLAETLDPSDRRYRYPFTNCTNCGPRFTIIQDIPYDRPHTTMSSFSMCVDCQAEYDDPLNRRFHAQPNACPVCGPRIWLELTGKLGAVAQENEALDAAQRLLAEGKVLAVKGLGGFHLACDAGSNAALDILRKRKGRAEKPFAVMAAGMDTVRQIAEVSEHEAQILQRRERPILLLRKRLDNPLSHLIAPGNQMIGMMLPYTPLHHLLFANLPLAVPALVMTSGNYSNEPIVKDNEAARRELSALVDAFLFHDRAIEARCDDSVVRLWRGAELPLRRSRGYAPFPLKLPFEVPAILGVGGELKATFCVAAGRHAYLSQHIGDMENLETLEAFENAVEHYKHIFRVAPEIVACDMHPGYLSSRWAHEQAADALVVEVQHHHAHIAAAMAENEIPEDFRVIGVSFDGTGYGSDGAIWGGEVLVCSYAKFERVAHLKYMPLPGGDQAVKRPYRLALSYLWAAGLDWQENLAPVLACDEVERGVLLRQLETGLNTVSTSSMGRLFDVIASLSGVRQVATYEAQAAIELESAADLSAPGSYQFGYSEAEIDPAPILQSVLNDLAAGVEASVIAMRFHRAVAEMVLRVSVQQRKRDAVNTVALSGGVFQNVLLLDLVMNRLENAGFDVLVHRKVPTNDGGLALGQVMITARQQSELRS